MRKKILKIGSLFVALAMILCNAGCSGGNRTTTSTVTTEVTEEGGASGGGSTVTTTTGGSSKISSEDKKATEQAAKELNGYTFTIASSWITQEENLNENSPLMDRLFWDAAHKVEKQYGCTVKVSNIGAVRADYLKPYIMAGKKVADLIDTMSYWMPQCIKGGYFKPWTEVPGIDISDTSKWNVTSLKTGQYNGKQYGLNFFKPVEARFCVIYNKTLLSKSGVDVNGLSSLVKNKKWTWDKLREYAMAATKDTNSDGINDTWGIIGKYDYIANAIVPSFGGGIVSKSGGKYAFSLNSSQSLAALNFYDKLVNTDKCVWVSDQLNTDTGYTGINEKTYVQRFTNGSSAFLFWESWVLNQYVKGKVNFDYGILPIPLGNGQTEYVSPAHNNRIFCVTSTNTDLAKASVVINALAECFGDYKGDEWYEDISADYFTNDKEQNLEIYKTILNSCTVDYGLSISALEEAFYKVVRDSVYLKKSTPASAADSIKSTYNDAINSVLN